MTIKQNSVVEIHYTLKNNDGEVLDTSIGKDTLTYLHGHGNLIIGLEKEIEGKIKGHKLKAVIKPEEAYGVYDESLIQEVERSMFEGIDDLQVGMQFNAQTAHGNQMINISKIEGDKITIDGNHALAGETLHFDVEVISVRDASKEELSHGHVHGAGGHHH